MVSLALSIVGLWPRERSRQPRACCSPVGSIDRKKGQQDTNISSVQSVELACGLWHRTAYCTTAICLCLSFGYRRTSQTFLERYTTASNNQTGGMTKFKAILPKWSHAPFLSRFGRRYPLLPTYLGWPRSAGAGPRGGAAESSRDKATSLALRPLRSDLTLFSICSRSCSVRAFTYSQAPSGDGEVYERRHKRKQEFCRKKTVHFADGGQDSATKRRTRSPKWEKTRYPMLAFCRTALIRASCARRSSIPRRSMASFWRRRSWTLPDRSAVCCLDKNTLRGTKIGGKISKLESPFWCRHATYYSTWLRYLSAVHESSA